MADEFVEQSIGSKKLGREGNLNEWKAKLDGEASFSKIRKDEKTLFVVSAEHFSLKAAQYFQREIAPEIDNPEEWYFLIEGKGTGVYEVEVIEEIAREKGVPMDDPIFSPFNKEVIRLYLDRVGNVEGIARATVIGYLAAKLMIARGTRDVVEVAEI